MPVAYGYLRISPADGEDGGAALEAARDAMRVTYNEVLKPAGFLLGKIHEDAPGRFNRPLRSRAAGYRLVRDLSRGDAVVIPRNRRSFKNLQDMLDTVRVWTARGIRVLMPEFGLDTGRPETLHVLDTVRLAHDLNAATIGDQVRRANRAVREAGGIWGRPPWGTRVTGVKGHRRFEIIPEDWVAGQIIVEWHDAGHDWTAIASHLHALGVRRARGRDRDHPLRGQVRPWNPKGVEKAYRAMQRLIAWVNDGTLKYPKNIPKPEET